MCDMLVIAIYDYNGSAEHDITFRKGDRFKLVNDSDSNWWHVMKLCDEGDKVPEHFYVPASYVELENEDEELPPPPPPDDLEYDGCMSSPEGLSTRQSINAQLAACISSSPEPKPWVTERDGVGRLFYHNTLTKETTWERPNDFVDPQQEENHYASLAPITGSPVSALRHNDRTYSNNNMARVSATEDRPANNNMASATSGHTRPLPEAPGYTVSVHSRDHPNYAATGHNNSGQNMSSGHNASSGHLNKPLPDTPNYMNLAGGGRPHTLQTSGQTTSDEATAVSARQMPLYSNIEHRGHSRESSRDRSLDRPQSMIVSSSPASPISSAPRSSMTRQHSSPSNITDQRRGLSLKLKSPKKDVHLLSPDGKSNSTFHNIAPVTISQPMPTSIPRAKRGYKEERDGDTIYFININTLEKWEESRTPDGTLFYASLKSRQSVWELPEAPLSNTVSSSLPRGQSIEQKKNNFGGRSKSMTNYGTRAERKSQSSESIPAPTSLEGMVKIKILCHPKQLKPESKPSWKEFYSLLESNNLLFYPNMKSCHKDGRLKETKTSQSVSESASRDKYSSACELNTTVTLVIEEDKRKKKVLKISKSNGLEMLFQPIQSTPTIEEWAEGIKSYILIERKSSVSSPVDQPSTPVVVKEYTPPQTMDGTGCDYDSIIADQAITKKTISNFLKNRPDKDSHKIKELLTKTGIGNLNNLDKDIRKKILKEFLGKRPTYEELKKKGLIKDTVFNCTLDKLCFREQCFVPKFIRQCVRAIEAKGLTSAGLYRIAGNHAAITKLRHRVDQDEPVDLMSVQYQDINLLAGCFKLFLRELPEPVIPWADFDPISGIMRSAGSDDKKVKGLTLTIGKMSEPNASVLHFIMSHLVRVASLSERNQMNPHNLSIIFGPSLLGAPPEKANLFQDLPVQNAAIELMITHFHQVFDRTFKYQNQPMLE